MNKATLVEKIAERSGVTAKQAEDMLDAWEHVIIKALQNDDEVTITGFGTFSARKRHARMGVNPQNPSERIQIPEVIVPKFKAGKTLKDALKGGGDDSSSVVQSADDQNTQPSSSAASDDGGSDGSSGDSFSSPQY